MNEILKFVVNFLMAISNKFPINNRGKKYKWTADAPKNIIENGSSNRLVKSAFLAEINCLIILETRYIRLQIK